MQEDRNNSNFSSNTDEQPNPINLVSISDEFLLVNAGEYVSFNTEQKPHSCDQCSKTFFTKKNLIAHLRKHKEEQAITSAYFQKLFEREQFLRNNSQECVSFNAEHEPQSSDESSETFVTKRNFKAHPRKHIEEQPNSTDHLKNIYVDQPILSDNTQEYVSFDNEQKSSTCDKSSETFTTKKNLISRLCQQIEEQPNSSDRSEKICVRKPLPVDNPQEYVSFNTEQKSSTCDQNLETFSAKTNLITLRRKHTCHYCDKGFRKKHCLVSHLRVHTGEKPFSCDRCGKSFSGKQSLRSHLLIHTGEKPHSCDHCKKSFRVRNTLIKHLRVHQNVKPFSSDHCAETFAEESTKQKPFSCDHCEKTFRVKSNLTRHLQIHQSVKPFSSDHCAETFAEESTKQKPHSCDQCSKTFMTKENLITHLCKHTEKKTNSPDHFEKTYVREPLLVNNAQECGSFNTEQKSKSRNESSETFTPKKYLITHLYKHIEELPDSPGHFEKTYVREPLLVDNTLEDVSFNTEQKSSSCNESSEIFATRKNLITDLRKHIEEQPNSSDCLEKICVREPLLVDKTQEYVSFIPFDTEQKSSSCDQNFETFSTITNLVAYRRRHACRYCGKEFRKKPHLVSHLRVHTGEKPFPCPHCERTFARKSTLRDHLRIHSGEKPFSCDQCAKTFTVQSTLRKHLRVHQKAKPFSCDVCGGTFAYKKRLDLHFPCKPVGSKDTNQVQE